MTLGIPEIRCVLCDGQLDPLGAYFRASGEFLPPADPLAGFCNAPMHWPCYAEWPDRARFARAFVDTWVRVNRKNPFWWTVHDDGAVYVSANPERPIEEASVRLYDVGSDIRVPLPRWADWLRDPTSVTPGLSALEQSVLKPILPRLSDLLPDDHAVVDAIDPDEKAKRARSRRNAASD